MNSYLSNNLSDFAVMPYQEQVRNWPTRGRHILAQFDDDSIVVYQAYTPSIGHFAAENGYLGGEYKYKRMTWSKPNFLWMMYRSGWGAKPRQEITLAIRLTRCYFDSLLEQAVPSTFDSRLYQSNDAWQKDVARSNVRLQWDPDRLPSGKRAGRRAIQLGLRREALDGFRGEEIVSIHDISDFVSEQRVNAEKEDYAGLLTPVEAIYPVSDPDTRWRLGLDDVNRDVRSHGQF